MPTEICWWATVSIVASCGTSWLNVLVTLLSRPAVNFAWISVRSVSALAEVLGCALDT